MYEYMDAVMKGVKMVLGRREIRFQEEFGFGWRIGERPKGEGGTFCWGV